MSSLQPSRLAPLLLIFLACAGCGTKPVDPAPKDNISPVGDQAALRPTSGGEIVLIPAGSFTMGDPRGAADEQPHEVAVSEFYMDRVPVTQEQYQRVMGVNPSKRKSPQNPVERTQWTDAVRFCNACSVLDGLTPCYDPQTWECNFEADGYRLPTEAEWEYACRAGSQSTYGFGDDPKELGNFAWFKGNSGGATHPVGQKSPNGFGLHDMLGNVWEWCHDYYSDHYDVTTPQTDPTGPTEGKMRVLRGGAWDSPAERCRVAVRSKEFPVYSDACFGADSYSFRRVRNKPSTAAAPTPTIATETKPASPTRVAAVAPATVESTTSAAAAETTSAPTAMAPAATPSAGSSTGGTIDLSQLKGTIVFVSDRSGVLKIWRMHASGKDPKQLTQGSDPDADPRFSPDGKQIMYTTLKGGFPEIWLMTSDGADQKSVTQGSQATWSPDGKSIVFIRDDHVYTRDMASGHEQRISPEGWDRCGVPAWSPDGTTIAIASRHLGEIGLFLLDANGKDLGRIEAEEACCTPQWSQDGSMLLCQTVQGHVFQVGRDGSDWEQQTFGADLQHDARYSPDGKSVLFCRAPTPEGPWQIYVKALDGDDTDALPLTREGSNLLPDWHLDE